MCLPGRFSCASGCGMSDIASGQRVSGTTHAWDVPECRGHLFPKVPGQSHLAGDFVVAGRLGTRDGWAVLLAAGRGGPSYTREAPLTRVRARSGVLESPSRAIVQQVAAQLDHAVEGVRLRPVVGASGSSVGAVVVVERPVVWLLVQDEPPGVVELACGVPLVQATDVHAQQREGGEQPCCRASAAADECPTNSYLRRRSNSSRRRALVVALSAGRGGSSSRRSVGMAALWRRPSSQMVSGTGPGRTPRWVSCRSLVSTMPMVRRGRAQCSGLAVV